MIIKRHETCVGFVLFKFHKWLIELWICPPGYKIQPHKHPNIHSELIPIIFEKEKVELVRYDNIHSRMVRLSFKYLFHWFSIKPADFHYFCNNSNHRPFVFVNFETWRDGVKPTSASVDFQLAA